MPKLTIIVGMAGSGKTHLCRTIAAESSPPAVPFPDATWANSGSKRAGHESLGEIVARLLGRGEDCVMDEAHLTSTEFRNHFKEFCETFLPEIELRWIFFKPDALQCINNVYRDCQGPDGRCELGRFESLNKQRLRYSVPDATEFPGREVWDVYRHDKRQFSKEAIAVEWLESEIDRLRPKNS